MKISQLSKKTQVIPVILAGGTGTRLWPLSKTTYPKQFLSIFGQKSLFEQTINRLSHLTSIRQDTKIVITPSDYRFLVETQLSDLGSTEHSIIIEPSAKDTAAAILAAAIFAYNADPSAILFILPSDHYIPETDILDLGIEVGKDAIEAGNIVTFGIVPKSAETGYGYLVTENSDHERILHVNKFIEKPDAKLAKELFKQGNVYWNSGMFLFKAQTFITLCEQLAHDWYDIVSSAVIHGQTDLNFFRLNPEMWDELESISIDYAIMEKLSSLKTIPLDMEWSDLGDWNSINAYSDRDTNGNVLTQNAIAYASKDSMLYAQNDRQKIVGLGLENIVAISTDDAVLVANRDSIKNLKDVVNDLKSQKVPQVHGTLKDYRPWGHYEVLSEDERFKVKTIVVKPDAILSLQSHHHRSEHWIVVRGTARVTVGKKITLVSEGESIFVPLGIKHRLENPGKVPLTLIEVQTGTYLGEDDIIRYEDLYSREMGPSK